jgi:hypothetical protein
MYKALKNTYLKYYLLEIQMIFIMLLEIVFTLSDDNSIIYEYKNVLKIKSYFWAHLHILNVTKFSNIKNVCLRITLLLAMSENKSDKSDQTHNSTSRQNSLEKILA